MSTETFGPQVNRAFIYGIKADPMLSGAPPDFPPEGRQIYPHEGYPGIIVETMFGDWNAILVEFTRPVPGSKNTFQKTLYCRQIDESPRAEQIRLNREPRPGQSF